MNLVGDQTAAGRVRQWNCAADRVLEAAGVAFAVLYRRGSAIHWLRTAQRPDSRDRRVAAIWLSLCLLTAREHASIGLPTDDGMLIAGTRVHVGFRGWLRLSRWGNRVMQPVLPGRGPTSSRSRLIGATLFMLMLAIVLLASLLRAGVA